MRPLIRAAGAGQRAVLRATRHSQAWTIAVVDRLAHRGDAGAPSPLGRLWQVQLSAGAALFGEPSRLLEASYRHLEQTVALHREFSQRLLEAIDSFEARDPEARPGNVVPLVRAARRSVP